MQAKGRVKVALVQDNIDHVIIRRRLVKYFMYYHDQNENWRSITNFADPECEKERIEIRCKHARQTLHLPYPFMLDTGVLYLWGLVAGAAHRKKQLEICVDANQEPRIQAAANQLGMRVEISHIRRKRRKYGSRAIPNKYRKIQVVHFPEDA